VRVRAAANKESRSEQGKMIACQRSLRGIDGALPAAVGIADLDDIDDVRSRSRSSTSRPLRRLARFGIALIWKPFRFAQSGDAAGLKRPDLAARIARAPEVIVRA
jgi:hypothetical protein